MADSNVKTDFSTAIGVLLAFGLVGIAISISGNFWAFLDIKSALIVIGGTMFLTIACFSIGDFLSSQKQIAKTFFYKSESPDDAAINALELAEIGRKEGLLALEKHEELYMHNDLLKHGMRLVVDGFGDEDIEPMLSEEIAAVLDSYRNAILVLRKAAEISPAMGLIGTLIGLIQMLGNLDDPSSIGPSMAIALLTTLYGAAFAFMIFTPLASKLERISKDEADIMDIYLLAVSSISKKENPRRLEMLINSVLSPTNRVHYFE